MAKLDWKERRRTYSVRRAVFARGPLSFELRVAKRTSALLPGRASWELHIEQLNVQAKYLSLTVKPFATAAAATAAGELFVDALAASLETGT